MVKKQVTFADAFDDFIHPNTYVNKLLFSGAKEKDESQATLQLWNIMAEQLVFSFDELIEKLQQGKHSLITCLEESPVADVIAIGFETGVIALVNLLYSEVLLTLDQSQDGGSIKSLTFSSDT